MASHAPLIIDLGAACQRAAVALVDAASIQWSAPPRPSRAGGINPDDAASATEPTERARGTISNPTLDIVANERRLKVRAAVVTAEAEFVSVTARMHELADELDKAREEWGD
jgi:hypothetical protein